MDVLDTRYGRLIVSRKDKYLGRSLVEYGEFSEGEVHLFRELLTSDAVVCDVGANIGAHTLAFSRIVKHVFAFEPVPRLFCALAGMVALNELTNVTCIQCGIGASEGIMSYPDLDYTVINSLGSGRLSAFEGERGIAVYPLSTPCNFLKVDVEGMEVDVLRGAEPMIRECKPILYVEADRPECFDELRDFIATLGYFPYWHVPLLFNPDNFARNATDIWPNMASLNLLCLRDHIDFMEPALVWPWSTEMPAGVHHGLAA